MRKQLSLIILVMCVCLGAIAQVPPILRNSWDTNMAGGLVNVTDYGADRTGTSDSLAQIKNAAAVGRGIFFPSGTYRLDTPVGGASVSFSNVNGIKILGSGANLYLNRAYNTNDVHVLFDFVNCTNVFIEGVSFCGTNVNQSIIPSNKTTPMSLALLKSDWSLRFIR